MCFMRGIPVAVFMLHITADELISVVEAVVSCEEVFDFIRIDLMLRDVLVEVDRPVIVSEWRVVISGTSMQHAVVVETDRAEEVVVLEHMHLVSTHALESF